MTADDIYTVAGVAGGGSGRGRGRRHLGRCSTPPAVGFDSSGDLYIAD